MPKSLQRPVVLLTGASSGIGYDVASLLARYGYTVYGAARRVEKIEELASEGVKALSMDVTDEVSRLLTLKAALTCLSTTRATAPTELLKTSPSTRHAASLR